MERLSRFYKKQGGSLLMELLISIGLFAVISPALIGGLVVSTQGEPQQNQRLRAIQILIEVEEAMRLVREKGWDHITTDGIYHPQISGNTYEIVGGTDTVGDFTREIVISDVYRDIGGSIAEVGTTTFDPSTKKVSILVSWTLPNNSSVGTTLFMTRYLDNLTHIETTLTDFNVGTTNGTAVMATLGTTIPNDGEITLGGGGRGDWCKPNLSIYGFNLDHSASAQAISAIESRAFAVTGERNNSETFYDVTITDTNPPTAIPAGFTSGQKKAYGVFGDQNYAYIAADTAKEQGTIIRLSDYQEIGWLDLQSNSVNGRSITVANNLAYLSSSDNKIYIFDISNISGTHPPIAVSPALGGISHKIIVSGNNLYAAIDSTSNQLVILPLTNGGRAFGTPVNITVDGAGGKDIFVKDNETRVYLATSTSSSQREFFVIDTGSTSATYKQVLGSYDTSGMNPHGITLVTNNKAIIVGKDGVEYQVVDVANDVVTNCSGTLGDFNIEIFGIASVVEVDGDAYSYIITADTASEFKIIEGGPTGRVGKSGTFESAIFDLGHSTAFNRLFYTAVTPSGTTLNFQVAVADPVSNSCNGSTYVYQDIDPTGAIPINDDGVGYENPAQCFRYKILFDTTTTGSTPVVYDVTANYSP